MDDAFFAGRVFVSGEQDGFRFFLWSDAPLNELMPSSFVAEPADGAFLCKLSDGWLFVSGLSKYQNFRHTFADTSPQAHENAKAMAALGIPILNIEEGNQRVQADGIALYRISAPALNSAGR